jgi:AraC-like DNA-binding protein
MTSPRADLSIDHDVRVSSLQVRGLCEAVEYLGTPTAAFLAAAGLEPSRVADTQAWFALEEFDALLAAAVRLSGDPLFGLHWGDRSPMMQFDLTPALIASAPTLRVAIDAVAQLQPLLATRPEVRFHMQNDRCRFECVPLSGTELGIRVRTEMLFVGLSRLLRYFGARDTVRRIEVAYPRPSYGDEYDRLLGRSVHFGQARSCFTFATSALDTAHASRNAELHEALRASTEQQRQRALGQQSYSQQLEAMVRATLPNLLSMADAARMLQTSERSLRRRLLVEGISYSQLVDDVQRKLAHELLALGTQTVKEVAYRLGFSSVSGFHRAFRRWTGSSPARERAPRARPS